MPSMRAFLSVTLLPLLSLGLAACGGDLDCGEGTHEEDGSCVTDEDTDRYEGEEPGDCSDDADNDRDDDGCAGSSDCTGGDTDSDTGSADGPLIGLVFVQADQWAMPRTISTRWTTSTSATTTWTC